MPIWYFSSFNFTYQLILQSLIIFIIILALNSLVSQPETYSVQISWNSIIKHHFGKGEGVVGPLTQVSYTYSCNTVFIIAIISQSCHSFRVTNIHIGLMPTFQLSHLVKYNYACILCFLDSLTYPFIYSNKSYSWHHIRVKQT